MRKELVKRMEAAGSSAYLVNTGWNGTGRRISIKDTRCIIDAILDGTVDQAETKMIPYFNLEVPVDLPCVAGDILDPRDTYEDPAEWETKARDLAQRFIQTSSSLPTMPKGKHWWQPVRSCKKQTLSSDFTAISLILAYLLGSSTNIGMVGKGNQRNRPREHGSGNAGATNAFRVLGKPIGTAVLVLDMLKGFLAVNLFHLQDEFSPDRKHG